MTTAVQTDRDILDQAAIARKISRMAVEIYEHNFEAGQVVLAGIADEGYSLAAALHQELKASFGVEYTLLRLTLDKTSVAPPTVTVSGDSDSFAICEGRSVVLVDDVLNSGRTLMHATLPLMQAKPARLEVAVLVARTHRLFPIKARYVGLSLATTVLNHVSVITADGRLARVTLR